MDMFKSKEQIAADNKLKAQKEIAKIEANLASKTKAPAEAAPVLGKGGLADKMAEPFAVTKTLKNRHQQIEDEINK